MDYSRGIQTLKETTGETVSQWVWVYNKIIDSKVFILLVYCVSNILYLITSLLYNLSSYRSN